MLKTAGQILANTMLHGFSQLDIVLFLVFPSLLSIASALNSTFSPFLLIPEHSSVKLAPSFTEAPLNKSPTSVSSLRLPPLRS